LLPFYPRFSVWGERYRPLLNICPCPDKVNCGIEK
jgi:hypothetical protein